MSFFLLIAGAGIAWADPVATTTSLVSQANPSYSGDSTNNNFTASVSNNNAGFPVTGSVTFTNGSTELGTAQVDQSGNAYLYFVNYNLLPAGVHNLTAEYSGDANNAPSTGSMVQTVKASTSVGVLSSANPVQISNGVTLTARINFYNSTQPVTGTVTFKDGGTVIGTGTISVVDGYYQASVTTSAFTSGTHTITAEYSGDGLNWAANSNNFQQVVLDGLAPVTVEFGASPNPGQSNGNVSLSAVVSNNNAGFPLTGTVTFKNGSTVLGTTQVGQYGNADLYFLSSSYFPVGVNNLTAEYSGDANNAATTATLAFTMKAFTSISVLSSANPAITGSAVTLTARVAPYNSSEPVTGTVTFKDDGSVIGTGTISVVDGYYQASLTTSALTSGTHNITAEYSGDALNIPNTSNNFQQIVMTELAPTTTTLGSSPNPSGNNENVSLSAYVTNNNAGFAVTGTVTFKNGDTVLGSTQVSQYGYAELYFINSSYFPIGVNQLTAEYSGDVNNASSTGTLNHTTKAFIMNVGMQSSASPALSGSPVTFTAQLFPYSSSAPVTGTVTFRNGGTVLGSGTVSLVDGYYQASFTTSALTVGTHAITADYSGDDLNLPRTSNSFSQEISSGSAPTVTTLSSSPNPSEANQSVSLTVNVTNNNAGFPVTGTVTFKNGNTVLGTSSLDQNGTGTLSVANLLSGTHTLQAEYSGDANNAPSSGETSHVVNYGAAPITITFSANPNPGQNNGNVTLNAVVSNNNAGFPVTGTVTFKNGSTVLGTTQVGQYGNADLYFLSPSYFPVGVNNLTAEYSGDANNAATTATLAFTMKAFTSISVLSSANPALVGNAVTLTARVAPYYSSEPVTGTVTFKDGGTVIGTGTISMVDGYYQASVTTSAFTSGTHNITAEYSGDALNAPNTSNNFQQIVMDGLAPVTVTFSANPNPGQSNGNVTLSTHVSNNNAGFAVTGTVTFKNGDTVIGTTQVGQSGYAELYFLSPSYFTVGVNNLTAEYSGDASNAATTATLAFTMQATTTVNVLSSANPALVGNSVTLSARVIPYSSSEPVTGTVTFKDDGSVIGTGTISMVDGYYQASVTTAALTTGTHVITAEYSGDALNAPRTSNNFQQIILDGLAPVTVNFGVNPNPGRTNENVTLNTVVSNNNAGFPVTGTVTFKNGSTVLGTAQVGQYGNADLYFLSPSYFPVGVNNLTAEYSGDASNAATTATLTFTMQAPTNVSIVSSANPAGSGNALTFTAHVFPYNSNAPVSGTVVFKDGGTVLGTGSVIEVGGYYQASFTTSTLSIGTHTITAEYSGDGFNLARTSDNFQQVITSTTTTLSSSSNPSASNGWTNLTAVVTNNNAGAAITGTVTFKNGNIELGTVQVDQEGKAELFFVNFPAGTYNLTAAYSGDSNNDSSSGSLTQVSISGTTTALSLSSNTISAGQTATFTATVTGGSPTGVVRFMSGATELGTANLNVSGMAIATISFPMWGSFPVVAVYEGNQFYATSSSAESVLTVHAVVTSTALTVNPETVQVDQAVNLTAVVAGSAPTGLVEFRNGSTLLGTAALDASGIATLTTTFSISGVHALTATYVGDTANEESTSTAQSVTVNALPTSTALVASPTAIASGAALTLTATVTGRTPTGSVTFKDGATMLGSAMVDASGVATLATTLINVGSHNVTAEYLGDTANLGSTSAPAVVSVSAAPTTTTITTTPTPVASNEVLIITVTIAGSLPTGTVTLQSTKGSDTVSRIVPVVAGVATFSSPMAAGSYTLTASYSGDANNQPSNSLPVPLTVNTPLCQ